MNTLLMAGQTQLVLLNEKRWSTMQYSSAVQVSFLQPSELHIRNQRVA